jgi:hypothetical protein
LIGGSMYSLKKIGGDISKVISGPKWKTSDFRDLLCLLFLLTKTMKSKGLIALEAHIEKPEVSSIFKRYPRISRDHFALGFICDTLRMMTMSLEDPLQVEDAMEKQLEKHHHEALTRRTRSTMADGLPALGIVGAVLGVIKTMGSITNRRKSWLDDRRRTRRDVPGVFLAWARRADRNASGDRGWEAVLSRDATSWSRISRNSARCRWKSGGAACLRTLSRVLLSWSGP